MKFKQTLLYHILPVVVLIAITVPVILPFLREGYFPTHDGEWAVVRLADMFREIRDGQIPARYSGNLNFGYGYPLFNFAYPLPYYLGIPFVLLHFGLVNTIKLLFAGGFFLSIYGMYVLSKEIWHSRVAGIVSAVLYAYFPFRMVDLFVRGSLGETIASVFFPFVLFGFLKIHLSKNKAGWIIFSGLSFGLLILSHNIMAVLFLLILIPIIVIFLKENRENMLSFMAAGVYGLLVSAFFWIPALLEKQLVVLSKIPIADRNLYYVKPLDLLNSPWGYAPPTELNGFTYQIGWPHIFIVVLSGMFILHFGKKNTLNFIKHIAPIITGVVIVLTLMMFEISSPLWQLPILKEINYPWTLLLPIGFGISLLAGYLIKQTMWVRSLVVFAAILSIVLYLPWAVPREYINRGDGFYLTNDATTTSSDELMPLWVKQKPAERKTKVEVLHGDAEIEMVTNSSKETIFITRGSGLSQMQINTIYYPGWKVLVDNKEVPIDYSNPQGVMTFSVAAGAHNVSARFTETTLRLFSDSLSIVSFLALPILLFFHRKIFTKL